MSWLAKMEATARVAPPTQAPNPSQGRYLGAKIRETIDGQEKFCFRCDEWWPADLEFFYTDASGQAGLSAACKACALERKAASAAARGLPDRQRRSIEHTGKGARND